jgi:pyruvate/2-oxoglutarate dehydrogenase complex dihydrolipoamide dehydrogenase (E3) component
LATILTPDLCVIGAGASGLAVAEAARRTGASVVMVEKGEPGGSSLRSGALALRALGIAAERAALASTAGRFGVMVDPPTISFRKVRDHVADVIMGGAAQSGAARLAAMEIQLVRGTGVFADTKTLKAGDAQIEARRFVIATGARPTLPDVPGLFSVPYFTTETIFDNTRKLEHLVVVGAGPMGLELALSYRRLGSDVTVVDTGKVLAHCDPELAEIALRRLRDEGVVVHEESALVAVQGREGGVGITIRAGEDIVTISASHVLVATGRSPNLEELGLDAAKIRRSASKAGALSLNTSLRTTNPRVYAVGEAAGLPTHLNALEAQLVVGAALLGKPARYEPAGAPRLVLTDPPIAEIGLTEPMARGRMKGGYSVLRASYAENDMARAERNGMGLVKLIIGASGKIVGAGIVGAGAAELAALFALAMGQNLDAKALATLSAAYPSYAELARQLGEQAAATTPKRRLSRSTFWVMRLLR